MATWSAEKTWTVGAVLPAADLNIYVGGDVQYLFNILNKVQAQTNGINVQQPIDTLGQGLTTWNNALTHWASLYAAGGTAFLANDASKQIELDASGNLTGAGTSAANLSGWATLNGTPFPLSTASAFLGSQQRVNSGSQNNMVSVALAVGTWLISGWLSYSSAAGSPSPRMAIYDGSSTYYLSDDTLSGVTLATFGSTTTVYLLAQNTAGSGNDAFINTTNQKGTGNGTGLVAVRVV